MGKKVKPKAVISLPRGRGRACEPSKADAPVASWLPKYEGPKQTERRRGGGARERAASQYIGADTLEEGDIISEASKKRASCEAGFDKNM